MNYEEFYAILSPLTKAVKSACSAADKNGKKTAADAENGNLADLARAMDDLERNIAAQQNALAALREAYDSFDNRAYFAEGDFEKQMLDACEALGVDVKTLDAGNYEMFPYSVKVNAERQEITVSRKKVSTARPAWFAKYIHDNLEKLNRASFNEESFARELSDAYQTALAVSGKPAGTAIPLVTIYKYLAPTARARKEYDMMSFSFDVARLYNRHYTQMKDGSSLILGPGKKGKPIRILDANGREQLLVTLAFFKEDPA